MGLAEAFDVGLSRAGFAVDHAPSISQARAMFAHYEYDLALLDLGLPDGSGLDLLDEWRTKGGMPIIVLTARGAVGDRVEGLNGGADDYLVKPIEISELVARCRAVLRRPGGRLSLILEAGGLRLDTAHREARFAGELLSLGRREVGALEILMRRKNQVVSRRTIEDSLYDKTSDNTPNAVDAVVSRLRRTLEDANAVVRIQAVRGIGWMLLDESDF